MRNKSIKLLAATGLVGILILTGLMVASWVDTYRGLLLTEVKQIIESNLNATIQIENVRFTPFRKGLGVTFSFYNVSIHDSLISEHRTPILRARVVRATLNADSLLYRKFRLSSLHIEEGAFTLFVRHDGYTNASIFERSASGWDSASTIHQKKSNLVVTLEDCPILYVDSLKGKSFRASLQQVEGKFQNALQAQRLSLEGAVHYDSLTFNSSKGSFLRNQLTHTRLSVDYFPAQKTWRINPSIIRVADSRVGDILLEGRVDQQTVPGRVTINLQVPKAGLRTALRLLPQPIEQAIVRRKILPDVSAKVRIRGTTHQSIPLVDIQFQTDTFQYPLPYGQLRSVKAKGTFTNHFDPQKAPGDQNSLLNLNHITGYFETIPLRGRLRVADLKKPMAVMDFSLNATPATVNALLDTTRYKVREGTARLDFYYEGDVVRFYDRRTDQLTGRLKGKILLRNVALNYVPNYIAVNQLNGDITFDESQALLPRLTMYDGLNQLHISGKVDRLPALLFGSPHPAQANVHVKIPEWKLRWPDRLVKKPRKYPARSTTLKISKLIDKAIDNLHITASLESDHMRYRQLEARQVRGIVEMKNYLVALRNLSMNTCGGRVQFSGGLQTFPDDRLPVFFADGELKRTNVESVFYSLGNFGQQTLTHHNMKGYLTADFHFESRIKPDASLLKPSMKGYVNVSLDKGRIVNFKPMLDIKKLIFKNRALENVQFSPLRSRFMLRGEEIEVDRMKIDSNVLYFFLDGTYSFGKKTDLSIQIPISNLKRKDPNKLKSIREVEDIKGDVIFLRAIDEGGDVRIRYDTMKRFDK